jgi:hypothetical protein
MLSSEIVYNNINNVKHQIELKKNYKPYFATLKIGDDVITDFDTVPYKRWYRGIATSDQPIVAEREAGWRNRAIIPNYSKIQKTYPSHCFQTACSTVYPCFTKQLQHDTNSGALAVSPYDNSYDVMIKNTDVTEYR